MASEIRVNQIQSRTGVSTISFTETGPIFAGVSTVQGSFTVDEDLNVGNNLNVTGVLTYDDVTNIDSVGIVTAQSGIHVTGGSVGIGTDNPVTNFKLDVNGNLSLGELGGSDNTYIDQKQNGHLNIINSGTQSNSGKVRINKTNSIGGDTTYFRDFEVYDGKDKLLLFVDGSSSRIGIGTDSFNDAAEVMRVQAISSQPNTIFTIKANDNSTGQSILNFGDDDFNEGRIIYDHSNNSMQFRTDDTERLRISSDGEVKMPNQPAALVYKTGTTQTFTSDGLVTYDDTSYSQGITITNTRSRMTVPVAGKYMVNACTSGSVTTASSGDGWKIRILKNGTEYNHTYGFPIETTGSATGQELAYVVTMVVDLDASDYVEIQIENIGGAAAQMSYGYFGVYLLG